MKSSRSERGSGTSRAARTVFVACVALIGGPSAYSSDESGGGSLVARSLAAPERRDAAVSARRLDDEVDAVGGDAAAWEAVARGDAIVLMRHALAPGTGDPRGFDADDCTTQRNLSDAGRAQAERIGAHVSAALGSAALDVFSSAWCRCLDTARLLGVGEVRRLTFLDSFFGARESAAAQTAALRAWIDERVAADELPPAVLVTHQVNVTALVGGFVTSGEIVVVDAEDRVLARVTIAPD